MSKYPETWKPTKIHQKSGWKNNPKVLREVVDAINDETYIEDENEMMEKLDHVFEWLKSKYNITEK